ncbi:DEAD/DEAH box helicase family protein [Candidatus Bathyarchaeota archaeon]|nr:DEAD/DEAH box helicase family protein [Candidatus Bathyarchaeota archaeon]
MTRQELTYQDYAKFMSCITAHYLEGKAKYDPLSVFLSSKIDLVPYQIYDFKKLLNEQKTNGNIRTLIAYETGLGKTILVGMIIKELIGNNPQGPPKRVLIITPPTVLPQFKDEMKRKFGLDFYQFETRNPEFKDLTIASMDTLKLEPYKQLVEEQLWDLIIVDEYHRISPYNQRGELISKITGKTKHFIALTATPHDGKSDRYNFRLKCIAPNPLIIRRVKREAVDINNQKLFNQNLEEIKQEIQITPLEKSFYRSAERYAKERFKGTGAGALIAIVIGRAVSSSIRAGLKLLKRRQNKLLLGDLDEIEDESLDDLLEKVDEGQELTEEDIEKILSARPETRAELEYELSLLQPVIEEGQQILDIQPIDSKGQDLLNLLDDAISKGRKCLIFTGFIETVEYLKELLNERGYNPLEITGRVSMEERNRIVEQITKEDQYKIIIGTDAMGESLNLQAASVEINYEVPWSPVSYIQRVGRIWRFGQKHHDLYIYNYLPAFDVERRVMEVMLEKIKTINYEFGEIGLSVFGQELGKVETIVKEAYEGKDIQEKLEEAYRKSLEIGREVVEVLRTSMELPKVVNVEELQRTNRINLDDTITEKDLRRFLQYLKDSELASGEFPENEDEPSTYHVHITGGYIRVENLSLNDKGIQEAIKLCHQSKDETQVIFNYHKTMKGQIRIYQTSIQSNVVYQEPILETPEGLLTYRGILGLIPIFADSSNQIHFQSKEDYEKTTGEKWLDLAKQQWNEILKIKQTELLNEKDTIKRDWLKQELQQIQNSKPESHTVLPVQDLYSVIFKATQTEESWRARYEIEQEAMKAATEYYQTKGYSVEDISQQNRGYDILCSRPDGVLRVEVKGIKGSPHPQLTQNEHRMAEFYRESFILFILKISGTSKNKFAVPDPIHNIEFIEFQKPVYQARNYEAFQVD